MPASQNDRDTGPSVPVTPEPPLAEPPEAPTQDQVNEAVSHVLAEVARLEIKARVRLVHQGQIVGTFTVMLMLATSAYLGLNGHAWVAIAVVSCLTAVVITAFLSGRR